MPQQNKLVKLEMLRGFAALYVFFYHLTADFTQHWGIYALPLRCGPEAVMLFFLLSGFAIRFSTEKTQPAAVEFFTHRICRIYPAFLCALALGAADLHLRHQPISMRNLFGNIFMLQDLNFVKPGTWIPPFANISPLWSLSYEWWFYITFFTMWKTKPSKWIALIVSFASLFAYTILPNQIALFGMYFIFWWVGAEFAKERIIAGKVSFRFQLPLLLSLSAYVMISSVIFLTANLPHFPGLGGFPILFIRQFAVVLAICWLAFLWQRIRWIGFEHIFGAFLWAAPISYGIYIFHYPICITGSFFSWINSSAIRYAAEISTVLLLAYFVDRQLHRMLNQKLKYIFRASSSIPDRTR